MAYAGHPGSQVLAAQGNNSLVEVWTKPLGDGRTAALIINTADNVNADGAEVLEPSEPNAKAYVYRLNVPFLS